MFPWEGLINQTFVTCPVAFVASLYPKLSYPKLDPTKLVFEGMLGAWFHKFCYATKMKQHNQSWDLPKGSIRACLGSFLLTSKLRNLWTWSSSWVVWHCGLQTQSTRWSRCLPGLGGSVGLRKPLVCLHVHMIFPLMALVRVKAHASISWALRVLCYLLLVLDRKSPRQKDNSFWVLYWRDFLQRKRTCYVWL